MKISDSYQRKVHRGCCYGKYEWRQAHHKYKEFKAQLIKNLQMQPEWELDEYETE